MQKLLFVILRTNAFSSTITPDILFLQVHQTQASRHNVQCEHSVRHGSIRSTLKHRASSQS